METEKRGVSYW